MLRRRVPVFAVAGLSGAVFALYAVVVAALFAVGAGVTMALPRWVAVVAPVVLYAILAAGALPRMDMGTRVRAFAVLCGLHALVAATTAALVAAVIDVSVATALDEASLSFMPAPLLQLLAVLLMALPLRALLDRRPRARRARQVEVDSSRPRTETLPGWQVGRPVAAASTAGAGATAAPGRTSGGAWPSPASEPAPVPAAVFSVPGSSAPPRAPSAVPDASAGPGGDQGADGAPTRAAAPAATGVSAAPSAPVGRPPGSPRADRVSAIEPAPVEPEPVSPVAEVEAGEALSAVAPDPVETAPRAPEGETIAVPFARIATVLPADLLAWDVGRVSAELAAPGMLLVPLAVVVPQLADGFVAVEWADVMDQFPPGAFRGAASEVAQRLPEGRLTLPLDEVVRRLPPEVFAMATPLADLGTLESFPLPFQPVEAAPPLPAPAPVAVDRRDNGYPLDDPRATPPAAEGPPAVEPLAAAPAADAGVSGEVTGPEAPDAVEAPEGDEPASGEGRLARLSRALSPVGSLSGSLADLGGHGVYLFRPPGLAPEALLSAIAPIVGALRADVRPAQLTVAMEHGAVVITPLSDTAGEASLVIAGAPLDGSLALIEILSLRSGAPPQETSGTTPRPWDALQTVPGGPAADMVAGTLTALGALTPSVIRDPDGRVEVCLLHAPGDASREVAAVAHAACLALASTAPGALGPVRSAVLRLAARPGADPRRIALRPVAGRPGHWIALFAPAGDARPGLVEIEIARAAARAAR